MLYTTTQAAVKLGTHYATVWRLCQRHGIGARVGRTTVLNQADLDRLAEFVRPPGNPNFVAGNYFGKPPKKVAKKRKKG
jgi:excisionase family DNA binding protein